MNQVKQQLPKKDNIRSQNNTRLNIQRLSTSQKVQHRNPTFQNNNLDEKTELNIKEYSFQQKNINQNDKVDYENSQKKVDLDQDQLNKTMNSNFMIKRKSQFDKRKISFNNSKLDRSNNNISAFSTQYNDSQRPQQQFKQRFFQSRNSVGSYMSTGMNNKMNFTTTASTNNYRPVTTNNFRQTNYSSTGINEKINRNSKSPQNLTKQIKGNIEFQNFNIKFKDHLKQQDYNSSSVQRNNNIDITDNSNQQELVAKLKQKLQKRKIQSTLRQRDHSNNITPDKTETNASLNKTFTNFNVSLNKNKLLSSFTKQYTRHGQNSLISKNTDQDLNKTVTYSQNIFSQAFLNDEQKSSQNLTASLTPTQKQNQKNIKCRISPFTQTQNQIVNKQFDKLSNISVNYSQFFNTYKGNESPKKLIQGLISGRNFGTGNIQNINDLNEDSIDQYEEQYEQHQEDLLRDTHDNFDYNSIKGIDCADMISKAQNDLKILQFNATNLICGDDLHIILDKNEKRQMEILPGTTQYIKIPIQGKVPPCRLLVEFADEKASKKNDLKICISRRTKLPSQQNCEKQVQKALQIQSDSVDPFYLQHFLYVSINSDNGQQFQLKVLFPKDDQKDKNPPPKENSSDISSFLNSESNGQQKLINKFKALIQRKVRDLSEDKHQQDDFFDFIDQLKKKRSQNLLMKGHTENINMISKNKGLVNMWNFIQLEQQRSRIDDNEDRIQRALQKKRDMDMDNYKKKLFLLNKWDILKVKRNELKQDFKEKFQTRHKVKEWVIITTLVKAFFQQKQRFEKVRAKRNWQKFRFLCSLKICRKFKRIILRKGKTKDIRYQRQATCVLNLMGQLKYDNAKEKASNTLISFLQDTSASYELINVFNRFYSRMRLIQKFFKEQQMLDIFRLDLLRKAWDIQRDIMQRACMKATGKSIKAKLKKLSLLTDSIREEFVKLYFQRSKLLFIIKFVEMHCDNGKDPRIEKYKSILKKYEKKLGLKKSQDKNDTKDTHNSGKVTKGQQSSKESTKNIPKMQQQKSAQNYQQMPTMKPENTQVIQTKNLKQPTQQPQNVIKKQKTKESKLIDGIGNLSLFFSFAPQPEQIRTMIDKAIAKQEKSLNKSKSTNKNIGDKVKDKENGDHDQKDLNLSSTDQIITEEQKVNHQ